MPEAPQPPTPNAQQTDYAAIRLFFVDEKTDQPLVGLVVRIFLDTPRAADSQGQPASPGNQRQLLATHQTDQIGYVSIKFDRSSVSANSHLVVTHGIVRGDALVLNVRDLLAGNDTYTIQVATSEPPPIVPHLGLPAIVSPDIKDLSVSPGSIGYIPHLSLGSGLCGQLTPTTMGVRRFEAFHILPGDICQPTLLNCPGVTKFVGGTMLEYEIAWHPVGTALGDLLNTLTLAPCEQINVAILDWMRREIASQTEAVDIQQQSFQEMNHDRLIVETMQSAIKNKSSAWSIGGTLSAGVSIPLTKNVKLDLTSAFGGGYSNVSQTTNIALNTTNQLTEHITQAASYVASQRSTVVFQAVASEQQTYQTRTVRNHNHCHTLTLMYYQINKNYKVVMDYKGKRDVILIKYDNADFDAKRAYCNAELLKDALLDRSLLSCFDELADALFCCDLKPVVTPPPPGEKLLMNSLRLTVDVRDIQGLIGGLSITLMSSAHGLLFTQSIGSVNNTSILWTSGIHSHLFSVSPPIDPSIVDEVQIILVGSNPFNLNSPPPAPPTAILNKIDIDYKVTGQNNWLSLFSLQTGTTISHFWNTPVKPALPTQPQTTTPSPATAENECVTKSCCIQKLLGHLNCHKRYYNSILWLTEDPNERIVRWSCCLKDEGPFSLISLIENDPIAVNGDFVVFPVAGSQLVDDPSVLPISRLVTMPTPGVYAEGILGQCDTCEKIDPDRFWDWKDSPCPDNAPEVSSPASHQPGVKPEDLKADAISNVISLSNVPGAPDSVFKDLLSSLISKADSGSAEAKELLNNLLQKLLEKIK